MRRYLKRSYLRTKAGSTVIISQEDFITDMAVRFEYLDEGHACENCVVNFRPREGRLIWECADCGGDSEELYPFSADDIDMWNKGLNLQFIWR